MCCGWLIVQTFIDQGPLVTITFRTADGIEVDKTRVKYKSLGIGVVEGVRLSADFSRVEVRVRLNKDAGVAVLLDVQRLLDESRLQAERATSRKATGEYGVCEDCGQKISEERLKFLPEATRCVRCQARQERE